jgi:hypothetical protein
MPYLRAEAEGAAGQEAVEEEEEDGGTEKAAAARTAGKATATMANYRILRISRTGGAILAEEDVVISRPEAEVVAVLVVWQVAVKLAEGGRHPWICLLLPNLALSRE